MSTHRTGPSPLKELFQQVSSQNSLESKAKKPVPFSIRLSPQERELLQEQAGNQPLGVYIRQRLLGEKVTKRRQSRRPQANDRQVAAVLAMLGQSNIPNNLNQLARHANMGTLEITQDVQGDLKDACAAVLAMRDALLVALGMQPVLMRSGDGK